MNTPKPTPQDLEREARRLGRVRPLEPVEARVVELRPRADVRVEPRFDPAPEPKDAA